MCYCKVWDLRKNDVLYRMQGHGDTVTGTELSPDGSYLLTTAMDNTGMFASRTLMFIALYHGWVNHRSHVPCFLGILARPFQYVQSQLFANKDYLLTYVRIDGITCLTSL